MIVLLQRKLSLWVNPPNFEVGHDCSLRSVPLCLFSPLDGDVMQSARVGLGGGWGDLSGATHEGSVGRTGSYIAP